MIKEVIKRVAYSIAEGKEDPDYFVIAKNIGDILLKAGQAKLKVKQDIIFLRAFFKNIFTVLCQPSAEKAYFDWAFPKFHTLNILAKITESRIQYGAGLEIELEDYQEIMDAFSDGCNPQWVATKLGEEVLKELGCL